MLSTVLAMFASSLLNSCGTSKKEAQVAISSKSRRSALILAHTKHS